MLNVALVCCQVYREGQELDCSDVGVGKEDQLNHVVHAVCVGQGVSHP